MALDRYQLLGAALIAFGVLVAPYSYVVLLSVPLTSLGLACVILGATLLMVPGSPMPAHQIRALIESSLVNIEAMLEEYDAEGKAVYLPPNDDHVHTFVPLMRDVDLGVFDASRMPLRVVTEHRGVKGLLLYPPGAEAVRLSLLPEDVGAEDALSHVLVDFLEAVASVKAVEKGREVVVELAGPRAGTEYPRVNRCLGSYPVSVAGCVLAKVYGAPVRYAGEETREGRTLGFYEVKRLG